VIRPIRWILLAGVVTAVGGCSLLGGIFEKGPPLEQYRLGVPQIDDGVTSPAGPPVLSGTLAITPYVTRGIYDGRGIVYRIDDLQLASYESREWAIPLGEMLGTITEELTRRRPLTAEPAVFDPRLPRASTYQLRGTVREFEEVNRARQVLAAVHLDLEIVRSVNDSVVWRGSERIERAVPPPTKSMTRVVETLSTLTSEVLMRLLERARTDLGTPAAATARPPG
jgi:ABC-type uncharacterized transport system auxiliary subunit